MREVETEIAELPLLALVEIFGDAAREGQGIEGAVGERGRPGLRHQQAPRQLVGGPAVDHAHDQPNHAGDDALAVGGGERLAERELDAEATGDLAHRLLDAGEPCFGVLDQETAADRDGGGGHERAVLDQGEFGGAAADVDIEDPRGMAARQRDGARAVRGQLAFHVMARRGADELAGFLGKQVGDGARVVALDGFAGQDHGAASRCRPARSPHRHSNRR